ncbi:MAG: Calx-beta domain-containing protein, partial [Methanocella sp.]
AAWAEDASVYGNSIETILQSPPPTIRFGAASLTVNENAGTATVTLQKGGYASADASVSYSTGGGNATAGTNYQAASGTIVFRPADTVKTFTVPILDDMVYGRQKVLDVSLSGQVNANIATGSMPIYINNVDSSPILYIESVSEPVYDNSGTVTINVSKAGTTEFEASADYLTLNGTAKSGLDFTNASGTITLAPGETKKSFYVTLLPDAEYEDDETFSALLRNPVNAMFNSSNSATVTISTSIPHTDLNLVQGWNLVSLSVTPENASISSVFPEDVSSKVMDIWGWNESVQEWVYYSPNTDDYFYQYYPNLTTLETGKAYWVEMSSPAKMTVIGTVPGYAPACPVNLVTGWNFVGPTGMSSQAVASMYPQAVDVWGWDESVQEWVYYSPNPDDYFYQYYPKMNSLQPGHGYWVEII